METLFKLLGRTTESQMENEIEVGLTWGALGLVFYVFYGKSLGFFSWIFGWLRYGK